MMFTDIIIISLLDINLYSIRASPIPTVTAYIGQLVSSNINLQQSLKYFYKIWLTDNSVPITVEPKTYSRDMREISRSTASYIRFTSIEQFHTNLGYMCRLPK